ncbi:MAG: hypothetical protein AAB400_03470, partial [Patescibacteria group bacterium]
MNIISPKISLLPLRYATRGFVSLIAVIIVGAIGMAVAVALLLSGTDATRQSFTEEQSAQSGALRDACIEEALARIKNSSSYTGSDTLTLGAGSCTFTVASQGGQLRTITSTGTVGSIVQKARVTIDKITPSITIASWQEV